MQHINRYTGFTLGIAALAAVFLVSITALAGADASKLEEQPVSNEVIEEWYAQLGPKASEMWPNEYGAIWYRTPGDPQGGVDIGFTEYAESKVAYLAKDFPRPELLHPITVPVSDREISRRVVEVARDHAALKSGEAPFDQEIDQNYDVKEDLKTGEVIVVMNEPTTLARQSFDKAYPFPVTVEKGGVSRLACVSRADCGNQLRAGIQSRRTYDPSVKRCSTGFTVWSHAEVQMLSAAHCTQPDPTRQPGELRYHGQAPGDLAYGKVKQLEFGNGVDVERIAHSVNDFVFRPQIYATDTDQAKPVTSQGNYLSIALNQELCRAGNSTGRRCGIVQNLHLTPGSYGGQFTDFVKFSACSAGGDSGGPVFYGGKAWGIYDGYVPGNDGTGSCEGNGTTSFFGPINRALAAVDATLILAN
ncbi:MAG: hypothetical protein J0H98_00735 [Solirubrobacterales bacterium]|nr:hypothetical protein [Solirubrobacterales bacterium]